MTAAFGALFVVGFVAVFLQQWLSPKEFLQPTELTLGQVLELEFKAINGLSQQIIAQKNNLNNGTLRTAPGANDLELLRAHLLAMVSHLNSETGGYGMSDTADLSPKRRLLIAATQFSNAVSQELKKSLVNDSVKHKNKSLLREQGLILEKLCQQYGVTQFGQVRLAESRLDRKADSASIAQLDKAIKNFATTIKVHPLLSADQRQALDEQFSLYQEELFATYTIAGLPWYQNPVFLSEVQHHLSALSFRLEVAQSSIKPSPFSRLFSGNYASIFVLAFALISSLGVSIYYSRELTIPVRRLAQQVENMVNSRFERIYHEPIPTRIAELQQLNDSVYLMASTIQENLETIGRRNEDLANMYNETLDNINTARNIQHSLLPPITEVQKALPDSFVLNRPKDIVSGDFYWIDNNTDVLKIAVADCTGHGVAGAFMSFVGHSLLTRIADETPIFFDAASMLDRLNDGVRSTLRQANDGTFSQMGMDISLVCIDFFRGMLHFAGANQTLYLIRNGELNTIKSNKFSIGGPVVRANMTFTNHKVAVLPGDVVYLTSDGFADQIGGPTGDEKFKTSRLRTLFQNIHQLRLEEQGKILNKVMEQWLGGGKLIDDVLVIGFKIPER